MTSSPTGRLRAILEACIAFGHRDEPWLAFQNEFRGLIAEVAAARRARPEFHDWLLSSLCAGRCTKFTALLASLDGQPPLSPEAEDKFIRDYLRKVVATEVANHWREVSPPPVRTPAPTAGNGDPSDREELMQIVRDAVTKLAPNLRLVYWLRNWAALGPIPPTDLAAVAATAGLEADAVRAELDRAVVDFRHRKYPISSALIGRLLDLPPDANGKFAAVDQRLRRAARLLRDVLRRPPEET